MVSATTPNVLFAVIAISNPAALAPTLAAIEPWLLLKLSETEWLIIAPAGTTAKEVSDRLGITGPPDAPFLSAGIVFRTDGYFGRSAPSNWEWIAAKLGAPLATTANIQT